MIIDFPFGVLVFMEAISFDIPVVATEHDSFERPISAPLHKVEYFTKFWINKLYDTVTVLTEADTKAIGSRLNNVVVMPNPLSLVPAKSIPVKENVVLAAGRLDAWHYKGFDNLIKAWGLLKKREHDIIFSNKDNNIVRWKLRIAGVGGDERLNYLKNLCKENEVEDSVEFLGFVNDMQSLYQRSSVFVLSSRYEGFGLVLIEAMSQGCAPVACDYKGRQREIINPSSVLPQGEEEQSAAVSEFCVCDNGIFPSFVYVIMAYYANPTMPNSWLLR